MNNVLYISVKNSNIIFVLGFNLMISLIWNENMIFFRYFLELDENENDKYHLYTMNNIHWNEKKHHNTQITEIQFDRINLEKYRKFEIHKNYVTKWISNRVYLWFVNEYNENYSWIASIWKHLKQLFIHISINSNNKFHS